MIAHSDALTAQARDATPPLLQVSGLKKHFRTSSGLLGRLQGSLKAVDGVDFTIRRGETFGLVGETGCGKSTVGRCILQLHRPTDGSVVFDGVDLTNLNTASMRSMRRRMQMIFQDPYASLDPRRSIGHSIGEPLRIHGIADGIKLKNAVHDLLETVGLNPNLSNRFPHEFSGGQRQRVGVARALAVSPELIVADEPISSLDVSIQAQIINLLVELQKQYSLTYLFIAHDLAMVRHISDCVGVMYLGRIVELAASSRLYERPLHPYSEALLSAVPVPDPSVESRRERIILRGDLPSPIDPPSGCNFRTRCWKAQEICAEIDPPLKEHAPGQLAACHFPAL